MPTPRVTQQPVTLRHIRKTARVTDPEPLPGKTVLATSFTPEKREAINGDGGFVNGQLERRIREEGTGAATFPNAAGSDGVLHRRRFDYYTDDDYGPGDEWLEVYDGNDPDPVMVFTPTSGDKTRGAVTLEGKDGLWTLVKVRETAAGDWHHAPRDVMEHYLGAWVAVAADDMTVTPIGARWETPAGGSHISAEGKYRLTGAGADASINGVSPANSVRWGREGSSFHERNRCARFEGQLSIAPTVTQSVRFGFFDDNFPAFVAAIELNPAGIGTQGTVRCACGTFLGADAHWVTSNRSFPDHGSVWTFAVELRGPWAYFYVDGNLLTVLPALSTAGGHDGSGEGLMVPYVQVGDGGTVDIDYLLLRQHRPYLLRHATDNDAQAADRGDYHLPGLPPPGGLWGEFYDDADLLLEYGLGTDIGYRLRVLSPERERRYARQDETLAFATAAPPTWQAIATPNGDHWSARWTGSIWLDLAAGEITLRTLTGFAGSEGDRVRLWVGRTMWGDQLIDTFDDASLGSGTNTTANLRAHLTRGDGTYASGWYPIVIEYLHHTGAGGITLQRSVGGAAHATVPKADLSPIGVEDGETRFEPHLELVKRVAETFGYQFTAEPRSLESGEFPCKVRPLVRVGRDTDYALEEDEAVEVAVKVNAEDVADALIGDAQGLARDDESQLTAERIDFSRIATSPFVRADQVSLSDITSAQLLEQRLDSLMALRGGPWEEVNARPAGSDKEYRDTFPLTGNYNEFAWEPGDGIRLLLPVVDVEDATPRQIMGLQRGYVPGGLSAPVAAFRQRTRNLKAMLRRIQRLQSVAQRHYQGQLATLSGSVGRQGTGTDPYSRVVVPMDVQSIVRADLVVQSKSGGNSHEVYVNDVNWLSGVLQVGRYNLKDAVQAAIADSPDRAVAVHLTPTTPDTRSNLFGANDPGGEAVAKFPAGTDFTILREASGTGGVPSKLGGWRDKHAYDGAGAGTDITNVKTLTVPGAGAYVFSLWVWVPSSWNGGTFNVEVVSYTGATVTIIKSADLTKRDQWQRIWTKADIVGGDLTGDIRLRRQGAQPTTTGTGTFYSDALQAELVAEGSDPSDFRADTTVVPYFEKIAYSLDMEVVA